MIICLLTLILVNLGNVFIENTVVRFIFSRSVLCLSNRENQTFAATRPSSVLLEQVAVCVAKGEPVLLVGETGTGKTSTVQHLARVTGEHRDAV